MVRPPQHPHDSRAMHARQARCQRHASPHHRAAASLLRASLPVIHVSGSAWEQQQQQQQQTTTTATETTAAGGDGILQLGQLSRPDRLQAAWREQLEPDCARQWQQLQQAARQLAAAAADPDGDTEQASNPAAAEPQEQPADAGLESAVKFLQALDQLLGDLQQVALLCGLLKASHSSQAWRAAAAAVFVDARTLEQRVCSNTPLQLALLLAYEQLDAAAAVAAAAPAATRQASGGSQPEWAGRGSDGQQQEQQQLRSSLQLARSLWKHMQLEGINPRGFAGLAGIKLRPAGASAASSCFSRSAAAAAVADDAQVLSPQEQRARLSGLQAEQRALLARLQGLLLDPAAAPVVQLDAGSLQVLLAPLQPGKPSMPMAVGGAAAAGQETASAEQQQDQQPQQEQEQELVLGMELVVQLLRQHADPGVRADVYQAGLLQRLDRTLLLWGELAEVRRRVARMQGYQSLGELLLQHSLLGSWEVATACCEQLLLVLQPAAAAAAADLQRQLAASGQAATASAQLQGSDCEFALHQASAAMLTAPEWQQVSGYLGLSQVMRGLDQLLQATLGLSLRPRPAAAGEVWHDGVRVFELCDVQQQQQHPASTAATCSSRGSLLGTIYLDTMSAASTQMLLYGSAYSAAGSVPFASWQPLTPEGEQRQPGGQLGSGGSSCLRPAVVLGVQSQVRASEHPTAAAARLWELCHELGHAVNHILSAACKGQQVAAQEDGPQQQHGGSNRCYHQHAAWLPLELLELPSTLFEAFSMDSACLQVICRHEDTGEQLPPVLAQKLAGFIRHSQQHPLLQHHKVLAMLLDLQLLGLDHKLLGTHAPHAMWQQLLQSSQLAATPGVEISVQQAATLPRLLALSGQGFGYAVAWCLAQLLQQPLLQHTHSALAAAGVQARDGDARLQDGQRRLWRGFLSGGVELADAVTLAAAIVELQEVAVASNGGDGSDVQRPSLKRALQQQGMWPLRGQGAAPLPRDDVLAVCIGTALQTLGRTCVKETHD